VVVRVILMAFDPFKYRSDIESFQLVVNFPNDRVIVDLNLFFRVGFLSNSFMNVIEFCESV
jgi:hypothetical protein